MGKIVTYAILPGPLTDEQRVELDALAARPDDEIDTSDIPEWTEDDFKRAERGKFYRPQEGHIAIRQDILQWLGGNGHAAIERADAILRDAMERERSTNDHPKVAE